jgi:hypothetical protein
MRLYRNTRERVMELLDEVKAGGYDSVYLKGDGDIADICRLTCLEQGIQIINPDNEEMKRIPVLEITGTKVILNKNK